MSSLIGEWNQAIGTLKGAARRIEAAQRKAMLQEAQFFRTKVVEGLRTQAPGGKRLRPLAASTLAVRRFVGIRGRKALIARADLRNSINVVQQRGGVFVGVLRTARGSAGQSLVNVAKIQELGLQRLIRITPKMRRFLQAAFRAAGLPREPPGGATLGVIRIPARPFLRPVAEKFFGNLAQVRSRYTKRLSKILGRDFGSV